MSAGRIQWETAQYQSPASARVADVDGHRLYVRRAAPRARSFFGTVDNVPIPGSWDTIEMAMSQVATAFRIMFAVAEADPSDQVECPGCGRIMSHRERDEQGICNDCQEGSYTRRGP